MYHHSKEELAQWVENMESLLAGGNICSRCAKGVSQVYVVPHSCEICRTFVELPRNIIHCPCIELGHEEAIKTAALAIEKYHEENPS